METRTRLVHVLHGVTFLSCILFLHLLPMKFAIDFFQGCKFDNLRNVFVRVIRPGRGEWPSLLRAFRAAHRQPQVLVELQMNEWTSTEESDRTPLSDADMEPLLTFPSHSLSAPSTRTTHFMSSTQTGPQEARNIEMQHERLNADDGLNLTCVAQTSAWMYG